MPRVWPEGLWDMKGISVWAARKTGGEWERAAREEWVACVKTEMRW